MTAREPEEWTPEGLIDHFGDVHRKMHDRRFAFILGAGASVPSGIPAAGALVRRWLGELHQRLDGGRRPIERWATAEALGIPGFSFAQAASSYSQVFARRFRQHPDEGYADLEDIMQGKDPSFGYSVLAHVLAETRHKLVITTNFDNLVADALSIFTATSPLVCGHESLANFIRLVPRRPIVVKIHRDLLMAPMNRAEEIAALRDAWIDPLRRVFSTYTPIVVGYGGNDGSLMGFLNSLAPGSIVGGIFWCYYGPGGPPGPEIKDLVAKHEGALVPIHGFDELMILLSAKLRIPLLDSVIEAKARARVESYRRRVEELTVRIIARPPAPEAEAGDPEPADTHAEAESRAERARGGSGDPTNPPDARVHAPLPAPPAASVTPLARAESPVPPASQTQAAPLLNTDEAESASRLALRRPSQGRSADASAPSPPRAAPAPNTPAPSTLSSRSGAQPRDSVTEGHATRTVHDEPAAPTRAHASDVLSVGAPPGNTPTETPHRGLGVELPTRPFLVDLSPELASGGAQDDAPSEREPAHSASQDMSPGSSASERPDGPLQAALQQIATDTPEDGPWSARMQAQTERHRERSLDLFRAALERFPRDTSLLLGLAGRLCEKPTPASITEAISCLRAALDVDPGLPEAGRNLALILAWRSELDAARATLARAWSFVARHASHSDMSSAIATLAFAAGLLARLQNRDDTYPLAILRTCARRHVTHAHFPYKLIEALLGRLDLTSGRLYTHLLDFLRGTLPLHRLEALEPRFAAIPPDDLFALRTDKIV